MNRRAFLGTLAALAGANAVALGTGAFSTASVDRGVSVSVVSDDEALLALKPTSSNGTIRIEDGVLIINTDTQKANGTNPNSVYTFGSWDETGNGVEVIMPAFRIVNQSRARQNVEFTYEWDPTGMGTSELTWYFTWEVDGTIYTDEILVTDSQSQATVAASNIPVGEGLNVAIRIESGNPEDEIAGTIDLKSTDSN